MSRHFIHKGGSCFKGGEYCFLVLVSIGMEEGEKIGRFRDESLLISLGLEGEMISSVIGGWCSGGMME